MKVFEHCDEAGNVCAIEVSVLSVGRRRTTTILEGVPGVEITKRPVLFSWFREEVFCEFTLEGERYAVDEPFGDSSRYWIGRIPQFGFHPSFHLIVKAFREAPDASRSLFGMSNREHG